MVDRGKKPETIAARLDGFTDTVSGGIVPPLQPSTTFLRDQGYALTVSENSYGRDDNEQVRLAEQVLCRLENGKECLLFATGMASISTLVSSLRRSDILLLQSGIYWGTTYWIRRFCERREITLMEADSTHTHEFCSLISEKAPAMVLVETPSNPWIRLCDIPIIAEAARAIGSIMAVDATAATPLLMKPLDLGADVVVHSATKAINGHSDVLAGVLTCGNPEADFWRFVKDERAGAGAILSAQSAWLLLRGIRTLPLRLEKMCANAFAIANFLDGHHKIEAVWYPGLKAHVDHELANRLLSDGYGYLLSFLVAGGRDKALNFCQHLQGIHRATSLGGTESLVEHRHTIEGDLTGCPENLIRLSVGIESSEDLISELDHALAKI